VIAVFIMFSSPVCAALSAMAAISCVVAGADAAGTALACGAVNAGLFVLVAVYVCVKA
jgi:hypothetical protein